MALLLAGCQNGVPDVCREARATDLPVRYEGGHLHATTILNSTPTDMIFDTGAQVTTVTNATASRLSLSLEASGLHKGLGGSRTGYRFFANAFQIGTLTGRHLLLRATDVDLSFQGIPSDGLLGDDFLAAYDVDLDLQEHKTILFRSLQSCSTPSAVLSGQLFSLPMVTSSNPNDRSPSVNVEVGGKTLLALIDSGSPHTLIFGNAARRLGLNFEDLRTDRHFYASGIGPDKVAAVRHVMTSIVVGDLTIQNLPVAIVNQRSFGDAEMLLGLDFLSRVHVWLSFSSHTLIMQYPPLASPPAKL